MSNGIADYAIHFCFLRNGVRSIELPKIFESYLAGRSLVRHRRVGKCAALSQSQQPGGEPDFAHRNDYEVF